MNTLFQRMSAKGGKAEDQAAAYLTGTGYTVQDVSENPAYQQIEIDLLAHYLDGIFTKTIEVKGDDIMHTTRRIFAESRVDLEHDNLKPGWAWITQAEELWYEDTVNQVFHIVDPEELRQAIKQNNYEVGYCDDRPRGVDRIREGFYIPVSELEQFRSYRQIQL